MMEQLMPVDFLQEQEGRDADGRFMKGYSGNPNGRPPGRRNKATEAAEVLLDGEVEALTRRAVELALDGQIGALRLCLDRIIPPSPARARSAQATPNRSPRVFETFVLIYQNHAAREDTIVFPAWKEPSRSGSSEKWATSSKRSSARPLARIVSRMQSRRLRRSSSFSALPILRGSLHPHHPGLDAADGFGSSRH